jgi:hypothetical protein
MSENKWAFVRQLWKEVSPNAKWDFIKWTITALVTGGAVLIAAAYGLYQKARHLSVDWYVIVGLFVTSLLIFVAAIATLLYLVRKGREKEANGKPKAESQDDQLCRELKEIARDDATNISHRVRKIGQKIHFHFSPGSDPHIDVLIELLNTSIFGVATFGEVDGHTTYAGEQLPGNPQVSHETDLHGPMFLNLKHGDSGTIRIRQFISTERAERIWADRLRSIAIDMSFVGVVFKVLPLSGMRLETFKVFGPRFTMDDVVRN